MLQPLSAFKIKFAWSTLSEEDRDYMEIYINGFEVGAFAGQLSGTVELPMARAKDNSFMIAYSKDEVGSAGHDRGASQPSW